MKQAVAADSQLPGVYLNNMCWFGPLAGYAERVLSFCDRAVAKEPTNGNFVDSRGLALALTGAVEQARKDFETFIVWTNQQPDSADSVRVIQRQLRRAWTQRLSEGPLALSDVRRSLRLP